MVKEGVSARVLWLQATENDAGNWLKRCGVAHKSNGKNWKRHRKDRNEGDSGGLGSKKEWSILNVSRTGCIKANHLASLVHLGQGPPSCWRRWWKGRVLCLTVAPRLHGMGGK